MSLKENYYKKFFKNIGNDKRRNIGIVVKKKEQDTETWRVVLDKPSLNKFGKPYVND